MRDCKEGKTSPQETKVNISLSIINLCFDNESLYLGMVDTAALCAAGVLAPYG